MITKKQIDYKLFKQALELIKNKEHFTILGFQKIVNIRASMNKGLPNSLKENFPNTILIKKSIVSSKIQDVNWLVGFAEGEGCFFIKTTLHKGVNKAILGFQITQHNRDALLINSFIPIFNCGRVEPCNKGLAVNFIVTNLSDINEKIIPFFNKNPLIGNKAKDFLDFKIIAELMASKEHLSPEGFEKIFKIKSGMNSSRIYIK